MAYIRRHGRKYSVRWRDLRGTERSKSCPTSESARRLKRDVEEAIAQGHDWQPDRVRGEPRLMEMFRAYLARCHRLQAHATAVAKARHLDKFGRFLGARQGDAARVYADVLTRSLLADYYADLDGLEKTTKKKNVQAVEAAWKWAFEEEEFREYVPYPLRLEMPSGVSTPTVAPTWAEMDACIAATHDLLQGHGQGYRRPHIGQYQLTVLLRFTGLRVQQAMRLRWDDVDLTNARLTVRGELGKTKAEKRGRIVPVSAHLVDLLAGWGRRDGWIVESLRTGPQVRVARQRDMCRAWARAVVREDAWKGQSHHAFRKGFVSGLRRAGADPDAVEYLVGHSLGLKGVYTDPDALALKEAVALIPAVGSVTLLDRAVRDGHAPNARPKPDSGTGN